MKHYTRVLARVDLDAVEYNIEMMKKNIQQQVMVKAGEKVLSIFLQEIMLLNLKQKRMVIILLV